RFYPLSLHAALPISLIADLVADGQSVVLVEGGRGGRGNAAFMSPTNRAPSIAEQGEFLRHTERARALVILLDPSPLQADPPARQDRKSTRLNSSHVK